MIKKDIKSNTSKNINPELATNNSVQSRGCIVTNQISDDVLSLQYNGEILIITKDKWVKKINMVKSLKSKLAIQITENEEMKEINKKTNDLLKKYKSEYKKLKESKEKILTNLHIKSKECAELANQCDNLTRHNNELTSMLSVFQKNQKTKLTPEVKRFILSKYKQGNNIKQIHDAITKHAGIDISYESVRKFVVSNSSKV